MHGSVSQYKFFKRPANIGKVIIEEKRMNRGEGYGKTGKQETEKQERLLSNFISLATASMNVENFDRLIQGPDVFVYRFRCPRPLNRGGISMINAGINSGLWKLFT